MVKLVAIVQVGNNGVSGLEDIYKDKNSTATRFFYHNTFLELLIFFLNLAQ